MNLVNIDKVKVKPRKSLVLKPFGIFDFINNITSHKLKFWLFIYHMFTTLEKIISKVNCMICLWVNKIIMTKNTNVIMQNYSGFWLKKFTLNTYLVVSQFLCRLLCLSTLKTETINHICGKFLFLFIRWKLYVWYHHCNTSSYYYLIRSLKHACGFIIDNHVVSYGWLRKAVLLCICYLSTIMSWFQFFSLLIERLVHLDMAKMLLVVLILDTNRLLSQKWKSY